MGAAPLDPNDPIVGRIQTYGPYGYQPKLAPGIVFTVAYAILAFVHLGLTIKSRQWWLIVLALGAGFETAGIALRVYGHHDPHAVDPYIAEQVLTVVTPVFFAAIHFAILGKVLILFGRKFGIVPPKLIIPVFVTLDVVSLAIQGAGSGIAAVNEIDLKDPSGGSNIVVGGLAIQLFGYVAFDVLSIIFAIKAWSPRNGASPPAHLWTPKTQQGLIAAFVSALLVLLRSCFRTGEMAEGWIGPVATTEWYFYVFDATPVTLAVLLLAIWHPSQYLPSKIRSPEEHLAHEEANRDPEKGNAEGTFINENGADNMGTTRGDTDSSHGKPFESVNGTPDPSGDNQATLRNNSPQLGAYKSDEKIGS
ncbi:unnamed protein product [Sympodiomycopsis kandeliae]